MTLAGYNLQDNVYIYSNNKCMCVFLISPVPIAEPLTSELIDTPVFYNLAPRPIKYRVSVPIPMYAFLLNEHPTQTFEQLNFWRLGAGLLSHSPPLLRSSGRQFSSRGRARVASRAPPLTLALPTGTPHLVPVEEQ